MAVLVRGVKGEGEGGECWMGGGSRCRGRWEEEGRKEGGKGRMDGVGQGILKRKKTKIFIHI